MEQMRVVSRYSTEELCDYLPGEVHQDAVLDTLREHDISGRIFVSLTEDDLKDLFPVLGERLSITTVLRQLKKQERESIQSNSKPKVFKRPQLV